MQNKEAGPQPQAGGRCGRSARVLLLALATLACSLATAAPLLLPASGAAAQEEQLGVAPAPVPALKADSELRQTASLFLTMLKALGALALVLGLIALLTFWLRKAGWGKDGRPGRGGSLITVLDTRMLAPKKYVAVLQIADEFVAVGITDQQINLLTRLTVGEELTARLTARQAGTPPLGAFGALLARACDKSGPHGGSSPS